MKVNYQTTLIVVAMVLGILAGYVCNSLISPEAAKEAAGYFAMVTDIFLRLVKMIIAPWCSRPWSPDWPEWGMPAPSAASAARRWDGS
jgi:hypothetical protein